MCAHNQASRKAKLQFIDLKTQYALIKEALDARLNTVFEHGRYIMGPEVAELEQELAAFVGVEHCIAVSSGTDALLIALMAIGIEPGDEVITTPFSFIATAEVIALLGAKPIFVDITSDTYNLDPNLLEAAISEKTKAIMPVSLYGQCADFNEINAIGAATGIPVIEDAAQSFGAEYYGSKSCALSEIGCTSFFPSKPLGGYGDSGACFTNDDALAKLMREIRVHGQDRRYHHPVIGINGRMDTMQAAILIEKLKIFPQEVAARQRIGATYSEKITAANPATKVPTLKNKATSVYAQYTIEVEERETAIASLEAKGIPTAVHYPTPLHMQPAFMEPGSASGAGAYPVAEAAAERVLSLPMHPYLDNEQIDAIVSAVADSV